MIHRPQGHDGCGQVAHQARRRASRPARRLGRRWRMRRAYDPSCLGRRRLGSAAIRSNNPVTAQGLRRRVSLRWNEVELSRLAPRLPARHRQPHRKASASAASATQLPHRRRAPSREDADRDRVRPAAHRHRARFISVNLPYPHQRPPCRPPGRKPRDKRWPQRSAGRRPQTLRCVAPKARPALQRASASACPAPPGEVIRLTFASIARCCAQRPQPCCVGALPHAPLLEGFGPLFGSQGRTRSWLICS